MSRRTVFITGAGGGIGRALCSGFSDDGWKVIATDCIEPEDLACDEFVRMDLDRLCDDDGYRRKLLAELLSVTGNNPMHALVNNAATQMIAPIEQLSVDDWRKTMNVNVLAPFLLARTFLPVLALEHGTVVNMASIHARLTKPGFAAYASSKAALVGLTRSMAVELGGRVRVNALCPAAIDTDMLRQGFAENQAGLQELSDFHPSRSLGKPAEVAKIVRCLVDPDFRFLHGAVIGLDGGIASRLHDPE